LRWELRKAKIASDMGKFAIVRIAGHQYKVEEGQEVLVDHITDAKFEPEVLLVSDGDKTLVGKPIVKEAKVAVKIVAAEEKGEKIRVIKYKSKSRSRKIRGFRPLYTKLLVQKITF
jgi:large subunit ribosomal protein L21